MAEAVATARDAAAGLNLEILGADVASQCLQQGLVDEILVYVLPVLLGDGVRFSTPASAGSTWNRSAPRARGPSPCSDSASADKPLAVRSGGRVLHLRASRRKARTGHSREALRCPDRSQVALAASKTMHNNQPALRATAFRPPTRRSTSSPASRRRPRQVLPQPWCSCTGAHVERDLGTSARSRARGRHLAVAVDLPGHGERSGERFTLARAFEILDDAVASFPDDVPVVVVGMSLGGYTSLAYAASHPSRLAGVVACACSSDPRGKPVALFREAANLVDAAGSATRRVLGRVQDVLRAGRSLPGGARASAQLTGPGRSPTRSCPVAPAGRS
ncbi:alpha/beta fold hydrolase [Oerskovia sp. M15]